MRDGRAVVLQIDKQKHKRLFFPTGSVGQNSIVAVLADECREMAFY